MIHKYLVSYIVVISLLGFSLDSFCGWDLLQNSPFRCCQPVCWSRRAGRPPELGEPPSLSLTWKQHCDPGRAKVNQLCHENTLSGYTPTEGLFSCVTVDSVRDCDTWLLCEMEAKIRTVGQYSKAQVGLIGLLVRKSPTTDSEGEVSSDQGHSCLVYGFLLRLLSCESRIQRKGKSRRGITRDFLSWGSVRPFTGCRALQVVSPGSWGRDHLSSCPDRATPLHASSHRASLPHEPAPASPGLGWGKGWAAA